MTRLDAFYVTGIVFCLVFAGPQILWDMPRPSGLPEALLGAATALAVHYYGNLKRWRK
jgi:hypothetical protein